MVNQDGTGVPRGAHLGLPSPRPGWAGPVHGVRGAGAGVGSGGGKVTDPMTAIDVDIDPTRRKGNVEGPAAPRPAPPTSEQEE